MTSLFKEKLRGDEDKERFLHYWEQLKRRNAHKREHKECYRQDVWEDTVPERVVSG